MKTLTNVFGIIGKGIATVTNVVGAIFRAILALALIGYAMLFGLNFYLNYENSREDWRNYDIQFNFEDGLSASYQVPVTEILLDSAADAVEDSLYLIDYALDTIY